jgi:hypothetical protein
MWHAIIYNVCYKGNFYHKTKEGYKRLIIYEGELHY